MTIVLNRFTREGTYQECAERLSASCTQFNLRKSIEAVDTHGSWLDTVKQKPTWILRTLMDVREPVLWLDADCELIKFPSLLYSSGADFAAYNWRADPESGKCFEYDPNRLEVSGGVMLFGYSAAAIELLLRWNDAVQENCCERGTDPLLSAVFNATRPPVRCLWLPKSYNRHEGVWPDVEPIINHAYSRGGHRLPTLPNMFHFQDVYDEAVQNAADGARFVEIGCWLGDSSTHMAKAIKESGKDIEFFCVDTWRGSEGIGWMQPILDAHDGNLYPAWNKRMVDDGVRDFATSIQKPSVDAAAAFDDESLDFVFIDGDHRYDEVLADIDAWLPKLKTGGMLAGDDYDENSHPGVWRAVRDKFGDDAEIRDRSWIHRVRERVTV